MRGEHFVMRWASRAYRLALHFALPQETRPFRDEMLQTFMTSCRVAYRRGSAPSVLKLAAAEIVDLFTGTAPSDRKRSGSTGAPRAEREARSRWAVLIDNLLQDVRHAIRALARQPGFAAIVVLCLALGIGANTAIFSVLNSIVLRPLSYEDPGRLTMVWETFRTRNMMTGGVSYPNLAEWRARNEVFEEIGAFRPERHTLTGVEVPERLVGARVTAEFFRVLRVDAAVGRTFSPADDLEGADNVVVMSDSLWRRHFGGDPSAIGRSVTLDGAPFTIVGVLPPGFEFPVAIAGAEVWTPSALDAAGKFHREWPMLLAVGRLRADVDLERAQADMDLIGRQLEQEYPETNTEHGFNLVPLLEQVSDRAVPLLLLLSGAVGLVLLIACANVANMLLSRSGIRGSELAVRAALGAGRGRLVQQLLTESIVMSLMGGALGVLIALGGVNVLVAYLPPNTPRLGEIGVDGGVLGFALAISILTGLAFGTIPAALTSRLHLPSSLKEGVRSSAGTGQRRLREALLVCEVALALMLLAGAGLLVRSFQQMLTSDPGFEPGGVLTFEVSARWSDHPVGDRAAFYRELRERMEALPGVQSAAAGTAMPLGRGFMATFMIEGRPEPARGEAPLTRYLSITPGYFESLRIPMVRGRVFTESDRRDRPGVVVVNEAAARAFWPDEDPLGQRIIPDVDITDVDPVVFEVVGIVGDVKDVSLDVEAGPCIYVPYQQQTWPGMTFALRTGVDPLSLTSMVRQEVASMTNEAVFTFRGLERNLEPSVVTRRFPMVVLGVFASLALALSALGIYGVLSYSVSQRTFELGLRMALGAERAGVFLLVLRRATVLVSIGAGIGLLGTLAMTRVMRSMLFGVTPADPVTLVSVTLLLMAVALLACLAPIRRATRVDPVEALRSE